MIWWSALVLPLYQTLWECLLVKMPLQQYLALWRWAFEHTFICAKNIIFGWIRQLRSLARFPFFLFNLHKSSIVRYNEEQKLMLNIKCHYYFFTLTRRSYSSATGGLCTNSCPMADTWSNCQALERDMGVRMCGNKFYHHHCKATCSCKHAIH